MVGARVLVSALVALGAGLAMRRHVREMLREGASFEDGGGVTVLVMVEFAVALGAVGVALS